MNALIRKEARLLLPNCAIGVAAALTVWLIPVHLNAASPAAAAFSATPIALACGMMLAMALDSFGRELSGGTFANLLSQPAPRHRIWRTKAALLAAGMAVVWMALWLSCILHFPSVSREIPWGIIVCLVVAVYSGGLWSVLLIRQASLAFWVTMVVPVALVYSVWYLAAVLTEGAIVTTLLLYSVAGFWWARRLFLTAEDTRWAGGEIALPAARILRGTRTGPRTRRAWRPHTAIFLRELMIHQSQWVMAGALAAAHLAVIAFRSGGRFAHSPVAEFFLERAWMVWLLMPVLLGCAAVAEDRALGTLEGQLCLPVSRPSQFEIKFLVTLGLSLLFGAGIPLLLEGRRILPGVHLVTDAWPGLLGPYAMTVSGNLFLQFLSALAAGLPWLALLSLCAGLAVLSFFASSLSRATFQALSAAEAGVLTTALLLSEAMDPEQVVGWRLWRGPLVYLIGGPVMGLTLAAAAFGNYQCVVVLGRHWRNNLLALLLAGGFVAAASTAVYHRAWERLIPEAPHGPARVNSRTPSFVELMRTHGPSVWGGELTGRLADGRAWTSSLAFAHETWWWVLSRGASANLRSELLSSAPESLPEILASVGGARPLHWRMEKTRFLGGTNWTSVANWEPYLVGIQDDDSLWFSQEKEWRRPPPLDIQGSLHVERFGREHDWKSVVSSFPYGSRAGFLLLKRDGTMWRLGAPLSRVDPRVPGIEAFSLEQVGRDSDWTDISWNSFGNLCRKTDGSLWWPHWDFVKERYRVNAASPGLEFHLQRFGLQTTARIRSWTVLPAENNTVGLGEDGALRLWPSTPWETGRPLLSIPPGDEGSSKAKEVRLGMETNWAVVTGLLAIKTDGSLWKWRLDDDGSKILSTRLGSHADWIGLWAVPDGACSLAADGGVWFWFLAGDNPEPPTESPFSEYFETVPGGKRGGRSPLPPLLAPSRRPVLIGNIFAANR